LVWPVLDEKHKISRSACRFWEATDRIWIPVHARMINLGVGHFVKTPAQISLIIRIKQYIYKYLTNAGIPFILLLVNRNWK
jgi:hypothetical protein